MRKNDIIKQLPYGEIFLFVDNLQEISNNGVTGSYTFRENEIFYKAHFKDYPITPGVILIECMAQIGLVCLGIYLNQNEEINKSNSTQLQFALSQSDVDFLKPVFPNEKVTVVSKLVYYRFNKLKCNVKMTNSKAEIVCKGILSGMVRH